MAAFICLADHVGHYLHCVIFHLNSLPRPAQMHLGHFTVDLTAARRNSLSTRTTFGCRMSNGRIFLLFLGVFVLLGFVIFYHSIQSENRAFLSKMLSLTHDNFHQTVMTVPEDYSAIKDTSKHAEFRSDVSMARLPAEDVLKTFSATRLIRMYISYLVNTDILCLRRLRMGNVGDGGWEICDDIQWRPLEDCLIYSFGINNDFSFDDHAAATYNCHVYSFDPSMKQDTYNRSSLVHFYKWGLSGQDGIERGYSMFTLSSLKKKLGHVNRTIDVVKMDIESYEWPSLPRMHADGDFAQIRQLSVEFHDTPKKAEALISRLNILRSLEQAGFRKFYTHENPACGENQQEYPATLTRCYEVHMVNINCKNILN